MYIYISIYMLYVHIYMYVYIYICIYICVYIWYICVYIYTYVYDHRSQYGFPAVASGPQGPTPRVKRGATNAWVKRETSRQRSQWWTDMAIATTNIGGIKWATYGYVMAIYVVIYGLIWRFLRFPEMEVPQKRWMVCSRKSDQNGWWLGVPPF